jgi:hypothetical protein
MEVVVPLVSGNGALAVAAVGRAERPEGAGRPEGIGYPLGIGT